MPTVNIVIIEDDLAILELIKYNLCKNEDWAIYTATNGQSGIDMIMDMQVDLIIVDWMLPEKSGIEIITYVRKNISRHIPIIMLTARGEEEDKVQSLNTGADDYVVKPFSPREFEARIKSALRRHNLDKKILTYGALTINLDTKTVTENGVDLHIKRKEYDILVLLMKHGNRVVKRESIINTVWGNYADIDNRTVDVHIVRLRKKMCDGNIIQSVWGEGYRLRDVQKS